MSITNLLKILSVPEDPIDTGSHSEWELIEKQVGTKLPQDYKDFITTYGAGWIGRFLYIWNPFTETRYVNFLSNYIERLDGLKYLVESGEQLPYSLYPESGGLLPFGATKDGDTLFWVTKGHPDEWHICIFDPRTPVYDEYPCGLTEFLYKLLKHEIQGKVIHSKSLELFTPVSEM
jgi:hypothetical protein